MRLGTRPRAALAAMLETAFMFPSNMNAIQDLVWSMFFTLNRCTLQLNML